MGRRYPLLILLTVVVLMIWGYGSVRQFSNTYALPFFAKVVDSHTLAVVPIPGMPLPPGIQAGDRIDLSAMDARSRIATWGGNSGELPPEGQTYALVIQRHGVAMAVPVTTVDLTTNPGLRRIGLLFQWIGLFSYLVLGGIALLLAWRGHGRAAGGMALWAISVLVADVVNGVPINGMPGLGILLATNTLYVLARIGLYIMVESMLGSALSSRMRLLWRGIFLVLLLIGAVIVQYGGPILLATRGWTEWTLPPYQMIWIAAYLVPVVMLFASYRSADVMQRLRLRWMLWSGALWVFGIFMNDTHALGILASVMVGNFAQLLAMLGFLYAVLRHRVVDVSVVIDRTLVYGGMTALVVGVLTAVNSLVQHAALGTSASLLLQVAVPLALGIVLGQVRNYANKFVEQVFFRKKYLAEKALRRFARHCGKYEQADQLFKAAAVEIRRQMGAYGIAIYERKGMDYGCVYHEGEVVYPQFSGIDDSAFVAARSEQKETDLSEIRSTLGADGYVFPMRALGELQSVLVCANRPGEHYATHERKLLSYVAHQMGLALYALQMQAMVRLVDTLARDTWPPSVEIHAKARELVSQASSG
ncbi:MAG TPA: hypothetical protein VNF46_02070 [Gammaproteobacteria bacterium]|nr:hypothetical protein [Gammaproteobacteria bacterium]